MFPMKFFEYLGAGCPVVSTDLPALRAHADVCVLARGPGEFETALAECLAGHRPDPALADRSARKHTWEWRTSEMLALIAAAANAGGARSAANS
jgi:hypothetical protein